MSSVVERKRQVSNLQFYVNAIKIRTEVLSIVGNENYVPKRKRFLVGNSTFSHAKNIIEFITMANAIYPYNEEMLFARKWYQQKAICMCEILIEDLRLIMDISSSTNRNRILLLTSTIINEVKLLRNWRNSSKILAHKGKYKKEEDANDINNNTENNVDQGSVKQSQIESVLQLIVLLEESWPIDKSY